MLYKQRYFAELDSMITAARPRVSPNRGGGGRLVSKKATIRLNKPFACIEWLPRTEKAFE